VQASVLVENVFVLRGELLAPFTCDFDGENKMTEKKMILCAIVAITIGIAAIVPLEFMMVAQAQVNTRETSPQKTLQ
jgi:hypothetical protein